MHIRLVICILDIAWHLRQQTIPVRVVQPLSGYDWWKKLIPPRNSLRFISFLLFSISSLFFFSICLEREKQKMWLSVGRHQDHLERKSESVKKKEEKNTLLADVWRTYWRNRKTISNRCRKSSSTIQLVTSSSFKKLSQGKELRILVGVKWERDEHLNGEV